MIFRKAAETDIDSVEELFNDVLTLEEQEPSVGWIRGVYPTRATAESALARGDLFVQEDEGRLVGAAVINQLQVDVYAAAPWEYPAADDEVMVLHTLCISPHTRGKGYGKAFAEFYERYALQNDCPYLRIDTNARNFKARALYKKLGYKEIGIVPCVFNGIDGVQLVLLEKRLKK